jgi:hypothetical protein
MRRWSVAKFGIPSGGNAASQYFSAMGFRASEDGFVNFAIWILRHHCAECAIGPYGAAAVAYGEIAAGETIFVLYQTLRSLNEILARAA